MAACNVVSPARPIRIAIGATVPFLATQTAHINARREASRKLVQLYDGTRSSSCLPRKKILDLEIAGISQHDSIQCFPEGPVPAVRPPIPLDII